MYKKIPIINPSGHKKSKPHKKKRGAIKHHNKGTVMTAKQKKYFGKGHKGHKKVHHNTPRKKGKGKHHNPAVTTYTVNGHKKKASVKKGSYKKRNPDGISSAVDPTKGENMLQAGGGILLGGFGAPMLGNALQNQFPTQITGAVKYLAQAAGVIAVYMLVRKYMPKLALYLLASGLGVTAYQYFQTSGLIAGAEQLLGMNPTGDANFTALDRMNFNRVVSNLRGIAAPRLLGGIVPNSQASTFDGLAVTRGASTYDGGRMTSGI